jgi:hypothetical protein
MFPSALHMGPVPFKENTNFVLFVRQIRREKVFGISPFQTIEWFFRNVIIMNCVLIYVDLLQLQNHILTRLDPSFLLNYII